MRMWSLKWWGDVGERAVRTAAQTAVALLVTGDNALGLLDIGWVELGSASGGAALVSILTSVATHSVTGNGPSFKSVNKESGKHNDGSNGTAGH